jgi:uncharacterized protein (TIGR03084 family)
MNHDFCADLLAEYDALASLLEGITPAQWRQPTAFFGWTPWDEVAHLCLLDGVALAAATDAAQFEQQAAALRARRAQGLEISAIARADLGHLDGPALLAHWRATYPRLVLALDALDPRARLPWFGPAMGARSFAAARLMETWAHGQDVYDALGLQRAATPRLRHIAHLGVNTYGWSFSNRQLPVPQPAPEVRLSLEGADDWQWNEPSGTHFVRGTAQDFCLVVTQRRHVADTALAHAGNGSAWLPIAQCFAGPPADPPPPRAGQADTAGA